ncbi:unnamed protein product [Pleuronectes platessa]|uniref:Uncharacterized protein n=1 Tax=Pleuronectes platessa TaxID=8262 RepID=A0A9N7YJR8_PLEPL|nr:unnamed protein product [Pleuronectes platessa]
MAADVAPWAAASSKEREGRLPALNVASGFHRDQTANPISPAQYSGRLQPDSEDPSSAMTHRRHHHSAQPQSSGAASCDLPNIKVAGGQEKSPVQRAEPELEAKLRQIAINLCLMAGTCNYMDGGPPGGSGLVGAVRARQRCRGLFIGFLSFDSRGDDKTNAGCSSFAALSAGTGPDSYWRINTVTRPSSSPPGVGPWCSELTGKELKAVAALREAFVCFVGLVRSSSRDLPCQCGSSDNGGSCNSTVRNCNDGDRNLLCY